MSKQLRAELLLLCATFVWGSTFVITKGSLDNVSPLLFITMRFWLATFILGAIFFRQLKTINKQLLFRGGVLGVLLFIGFVLQTEGLQYTTASKSAFFTGMLVVFTPILHFIIEKKLPKVGNAVGVILSIIGLYLLTSPEGSEFNRGDAMTLVCAMLFALFIVYLDHISATSNRSLLTFLQVAVCAVLGTLGTLLFEPVIIQWNGNVIFSLLYLTIFASIGAMWVQNQYQMDTTPTRAAVIFTLEPVIAAVCAYFVRGELLGTAGMIGAGVIITGLLISEFSGVIPGMNMSLSGSLEETK